MGLFDFFKNHEIATADARELFTAVIQRNSIGFGMMSSTRMPVEHRNRFERVFASEKYSPEDLRELLIIAEVFMYCRLARMQYELDRRMDINECDRVEKCVLELLLRAPEMGWKAADAFKDLFKFFNEVHRATLFPNSGWGDWVLLTLRARKNKKRRQDYHELTEDERILGAQVDKWVTEPLQLYASSEAVRADDPKIAAMRYRIAAEQGNASAQTYLGIMYAEGEGVPKDDIEAAKWYRKAAEQGNASAQFNLGSMYAEGEGVPKDNVEAAKWYRKAAEQGNASIQSILGSLYQLGRGVPKDDIEAYKWYLLACAQGNELAKKNMSNLEARLTPAQRAEGQRLAREWKPKK